MFIITINYTENKNTYQVDYTVYIIIFILICIIYFILLCNKVCWVKNESTFSDNRENLILHLKCYSYNTHLPFQKQVIGLLSQIFITFRTYFSAWNKYIHRYLMSSPNRFPGILNIS